MAERGQQTIRILKGMILDVAKEYIKDAASFLKNCLTDFNAVQNSIGVSLQSGENHNVGILTPVPSNELISTERMPAGQNITIGSKYDRRLNQFFYFVWNSTNLHTIWVLDCNDINAQGTPAAPDKILQSSLLNFDLHHLITSIDIVIANVKSGENVENLQRLVYFTDGFNPPRKINVDVALAGGYGALTFLRSPDEFINLVKYPPLDVDVTNTLTNPDPSYLLNFVANKQFQFGYVYYYQDGEHSTMSSISTFAYSVNTARNFIELSMSAGSSLVTYVLLYYRSSNTSAWRNFDKISRSIIVANVTYPYNNGTNIFIYKFFNNKQYNVVDQVDINRLFDIVPLQSFAGLYVESNTYQLGNNLEGYDNLTQAQRDTPTISVIYSQYHHLQFNWNITWNYTYATQDIVFYLRRKSALTGLTTTEFTGSITAVSAHPYTNSGSVIDATKGDKMWWEFKFNSDSILSGNRDFQGVWTNIINSLPCGTGFLEVEQTGNQAVVLGNRVTFTTIDFDTCSQWTASASPTNFNANQMLVPFNAEGASQLKQGGVYKVDFIMYDAALRSSFVQDSIVRLVTLESIQSHSKFQKMTLTMNWNGLVLPDWVKYVKICRTKNLNIDRSLGLGYLQFQINFDNNILTGGFLKYDGTSGDPTVDTIVKIRFSLTELIQYNTDNYENTTTTYTWTKGDRLQFIRNGNGTWFDFATYGLIDEELSTDPAAPNVTFLCDYNAGLVALLDETWVELYTPAQESQTDIFYEIGDFIPTTGVPSNNQVNSATTILTTFDTYAVQWHEPYIDDLVTDNGTTPFEHHSIYLNTTVPSNGEDIGRINVINVDAFQQWYPARIRKSNAYIPNSFYNGLSTFVDSDANKIDLNRADGGISQLSDNGYMLYVYQEERVVGIMMAKQLVALANGETQLVATPKFYSDPIILKDNEGNISEFGLQNSEGFVDADGLMFFPDTKRGAWVEFDGQKLTDISREGFAKSYADYKLKAAFKYNNQEYVNEKCCWDTTGFAHLSANWYVNLLINGEYTKITAAGAITTATQLAALINTASPFDTVPPQIIVRGNSICFFGSALRGYTFGNILIFNNTDVLQSTLLLVCTVDYITLPAGYNPKQKQYISTYFNLNTKPHYAYDLSVGFTTGESVSISIDINGATQSTTTSILGLAELQAILNELIRVYVNANINAVISGASVSDRLFLIENNTKFYIISSSGFLYGDIIIGADTFSPDTTTQYQYVNNEYGIATGGSKIIYPIVGEQPYGVQMERAETIAWSILNRRWDGFLSFTPEFYTYNDANSLDLVFVSFKEGFVYLHNIPNIGYNNFYTYQCDQILRIVFNEGAVTEKRFTAIALDSKNKESSITAMRYIGYLITTSDNQRSNIPIEAFVFKENFLYSAIFRAIDLGGTIQNGQGIRGKWMEITLVRNRDESLQNTYSEFASATGWFYTSAKAIIGK